MMKKQTLLLVSSIAFVLAGCSSNPHATVEQQAEARLNEQKAAVQEQQAQVENYLNTVPKWVLEPPQADKEGFYATGIGKAKDLSVSLSKATLQAEFNLAKAYSQVLSANEKSFKQEEYEQYTQVVDSFINQVDLTGYIVSKREVAPVSGEINSYVLLKMPYASFNKAMMNEIKKSNDEKAKQAFKDLQDRLDKVNLSAK